MTRWIRKPDTERGTGRTSQMLDEVMKCTARFVVVVAANEAHARILAEELKSRGANMRAIEVTTYDNLRKGRPLDTKHFWDHNAVDEWERKEIEYIIKLADRRRAHTHA